MGAGIRLLGTGGEASGLRRYLRFSRGPRAISELDGIRALAILLVLCRHGVRPYWDGVGSLLPVAGWDLGVPLINGWIGVDLFFVLSGFLITHHVIHRYGDRFGRADMGDYMLRRALRIVPLYFAVLYVAAAGLFPAYDVPPAGLGFRVAYHMLFLQDYLPANIVVVFWSLGVEEKFYLLAPLILMVILRLSGRQQYVGLLALASVPTVLRAVTAARHPEVTQYEAFFPVFRSPFHLTFDGLILGSLCALVVRDGVGPARGSIGAHALFWGGASVLLWLVGWDPLLDRIDWFDKVFLEGVLAVAVAAVLVGLVQGGGPGRLFRHRSLLVVSKISYALYLVHFPMVPLAQGLVARVAGPGPAQTLSSFALFVPLYVLLSFVVAFAFHYAIEKPFLILKDRLPAPASAALRPRPAVTA